MAQEPGRSQSSSPPRSHRGLRKEESDCFRRIPRPSADYEVKKQRWQSTGVVVRGDGQILNRARTGYSEATNLASPGQKAARNLRHWRSGQDFQVLDVQEERCALVLNLIYPTSQHVPAVQADANTAAKDSFMPGRAGRTTLQHKELPLPEVAAKLRVPSPQPEASTSATGALPHISSGHLVRQPTQHKSAAPPPPPEDTAPKDPELQLLKPRGNNFDPKDSSQGRTVIRLIQGALSSDVKTDARGRLTFVHPDQASFMKSSGSRRSQHAEEKKAKEMQDNIVKFSMLRNFRKTLLDVYPSVQAAFNELNDDTTELSMREFLNLITEPKTLHGRQVQLLNPREARLIYELMDSDKDGRLTLDEFHIGIEAIAPVQTMETMRKRLICLGYASVLHAIQTMNGGGEDMTMKPLTFGEFAAALKTVWILEPAEHRAIWDAVRDPGDPAGLATLSELAAALAVVSPSLLLEDLNERLHSVYGSLPDAYEAVCMEDGSCVDFDRFQAEAINRLGLTQAEVAKLIRFIDIDGSGVLDREEFIGAIDLSVANLNMEDLRLKVRQSYQSIDQSFREHFAHDENEELNDDMLFTATEFVAILEHLRGATDEQLWGAMDTQRLAAVMEATCEQGLTLYSFFKGLRLFAPSCVLMGFRMELLRQGRRVSDAFHGVTDRRAPLNQSAFADLLKSCNIKCGDVDRVFDFLDIRSSGVVTVSEVIAAMQNMHPGRLERLPTATKLAKAQEQVRENLAPIRKVASELKFRVKQDPARAESSMPLAKSAASGGHKEKKRDTMHLRKVANDFLRGKQDPVRAKDALSTLLKGIPGTDDEQAAAGGSKDARSGAARRGDKGRGAGGLRSTLPPISRSMPNLRTPELERLAHGRMSFQKISTTLQTLPPPHDVKETVDALRGYFGSAQRAIRDHEPYIEKRYTRTVNRSDCRRHEQVA
mmetsp:Transcript_42215/g.99083  ORF Transcript_42215/g.99083 Transcript_42215/m.99083 type:complete len:939 (-) Transcript_42215:12-2828(-)